MNQTPLSCDHLFLIFFATFSNILIMNITDEHLLIYAILLFNLTFKAICCDDLRLAHFESSKMQHFLIVFLLKSQKSYHDRLFSI